MTSISALASGEGTCVVHLVWAPLGLEPFRRFVTAYRQNPGGAPHRLLVVYNGFQPGDDRASYRAELETIAHDEMVLPQPVQDLSAYFTAAESAKENRVCFLNSYSSPLDPDWLKKLSGGLNQPGIGAVSATGSAESLLSHYRATGYPPGRRLYNLAIFPIKYVIGWCQFHPFPNYHLRTNAFLIRREHFLRMRRPLTNKAAAERLESGRRGFAAQLRSQGLAIGVVGRDGECYPPERWAQSRTFRSGEQENLLVADNRTLQYAEADPPLRQRLARAAWGEQADRV